MDLKPKRADIVAVMAYLGSQTSDKKAAAARKNGRLGGRPCGKKNKKKIAG